MPQWLWDASALSKRYTLEAGTDTVNALFVATLSDPRATTYLCYAETCSGLRRKLNRGEITLVLFNGARSLLWSEVLDDPNFQLRTIEDDDILDGVELIDQHNLNSSDAAILAAYLRYTRTQPPVAPTCVLISADQRFLRAAELEGLHVINPELVPATDIPALLAAL